MWRCDTSAGLDEMDFWAGNQKIATYQFSALGNPWLALTLKATNVYFGNKLASNGTSSSFCTCSDKVTLAPVAADRLGSIGKFYPYGQEKPSATTNDTEKFTGYFRDQATGLDYADQRYHQPGVGRFMTPDSAGKSRLGDPSSWNRYAYAGGDPVNHVDPTGQDWNDWVSSWDPYYNAWWEGNTGDSGYQFDIGSFISVILAQYWQSLEDETSENFTGPAQTRARVALGKVPCFTLLGFAAADVAQAFLDSKRFVNVRLGVLQLTKQGVPDLENTPPPARTNLETGQIQINDDYHWSDFSTNPSNFGTYDYLHYWNQRLGTQMSNGEFGALIVLHELGHALGINSDAPGFNRKIWEDCIN